MNYGQAFPASCCICDKFNNVNAGYHHRSIGNLLDTIKTCFGKSYTLLKMLEFGNQEFHDVELYNIYKYFQRYNYSNQNLTAKNYFTYLGIDHTSVDIN